MSDDLTREELETRIRGILRVIGTEDDPEAYLHLSGDDPRLQAAVDKAMAEWVD